MSDEYNKTVTVELPVSVWNELLADLNIYRIENRQEFEVSARSAKRAGGEIARQMNKQVEMEFDEFAGKNIHEIEQPREME